MSKINSNCVLFTPFFSVARKGSTFWSLLFFAFSFGTFSGQAKSDDALHSLLEQYAETSLTLDSDEELEAPLRSLLSDAERLRDANSDNASYWLAAARIRFGYADTQGPVRGMQQISLSREELETAITIDPFVQDGYAKAYLGYLHSVMPRWPLSFGDRDTGRRLLEEAILINENSIPNNYFYAVYLTVTKDYDGAARRLDVAEAQISSDTGTPNQQAFFAKSIKSLRTNIDNFVNER